ncbi:RNA polymerase sigma factor (sigma-70 family) [Prauserella isguenensis]|uniref:RNA polymerase sigma factor (Sigma-70 family) n=1 Tax=Prauserella isguenensis TaxID=1470180 RepID=A0A839RYC7_9PSEU|nr:sigma-70 family RNA polymerase sigma factor [Prauserella isguenensis]MBB3049527.1 RNA polymerase sigma factor (sigma-70 family) [Prauserella isguenensis]
MDRTVTATDEARLLERLRQGEDDAFGELFELHVASVRRLARGIARDGSEAEDITAETFFRVLQAVRRGNGPRDNVRAYLLTVARRVTWEWQAARRDVPVSDDELTTRVGGGADAQSSTAEASLITRAFSSLPERWRTVLWQTEVEGVQPANVAPEFGLSPNATAALARRARIGLRAAYLQAHLATGRSSNGCRTIVEKLGGYTAGSVTGAEARKVKAHLSACSSCRSTHDELRDVCSSLRSHAGVLVLLVPAAGVVANWGGAASGVVSEVAGSAAGASGSAAGSVSGTAGGLAALGGHVKVGLAVASTVAVGAAGVAGVADLSDDGRQTIGLHGGPRGDLQLVEPPPVGPEVDRKADRDGPPRDERGEAAEGAVADDGAQNGAVPNHAVRDNGTQDDRAPGDGDGDERGPMADTDYSVPGSERGHSARAKQPRNAPRAGSEPQPRAGQPRAGQPEPGAERGPRRGADGGTADSPRGAGVNVRSDRSGGTARSDVGAGGDGGTDGDDNAGRGQRNGAPAGEQAAGPDRAPGPNKAPGPEAAPGLNKAPAEDKAAVAKRLAHAWAEKAADARRDRARGFEPPTERPGVHSAAAPDRSASAPDRSAPEPGDKARKSASEPAPRLDDGDERAHGGDHPLPKAGPDHQGRKPAGAYFRGE